MALQDSFPARVFFLVRLHKPRQNDLCPIIVDSPEARCSLD